MIQIKRAPENLNSMREYRRRWANIGILKLIISHLSLTIIIIMQKHRKISKHFPSTVIYQPSPFPGTTPFFLHSSDSPIVEHYQNSHIKHYLPILDIPLYSRLQMATQLSQNMFHLLLSDNEDIYSVQIDTSSYTAPRLKHLMGKKSIVSETVIRNNSEYLSIVWDEEKNCSCIVLFKNISSLEQNSAIEIRLPNIALSQRIAFSGDYRNPYRLTQDRFAIKYQEESSEVVYLSAQQSNMINRFSLQKQALSYSLRLPNLRADIQNPEEDAWKKIMYKYIPTINPKDSNLVGIYNDETFGLVDYRCPGIIYLAQNHHQLQFINKNDDSQTRFYELYAIHGKQIYAIDIRKPELPHLQSQRVLRHDASIEKAYELKNYILVQEYESSSSYIYCSP